MLPGSSEGTYVWEDQNFDIEIIKSIRNLIHPFTPMGFSLTPLNSKEKIWLGLTKLGLIYLVRFPYRVSYIQTARGSIILEAPTEGHEKSLSQELLIKRRRKYGSNDFQEIYERCLRRAKDRGERPELDIVWANHRDLDLAIEKAEQF
jgi:hypothetical protein